MTEKQIEKSIVKYLETTWWLVESMQGWKIMVKKWKYNHRMTLNSKWCPDILFYYKNMLYWIEVKKNQEEINDWLKIEKRFNWIWKPLPLPYINKKWKLVQSNEREINQIQYKQKILKNWWTFILTCELQEIINYLWKNEIK